MNPYVKKIYIAKLTRRPRYVTDPEWNAQIARDFLAPAYNEQLKKAGNECEFYVSKLCEAMDE